MKLWMRRLHLVIAAVSAVFLVCLCISGILLAYAKDIQRSVAPEYWLLSTPISTSQVEFARLLEHIEKQTGETVQYIEPGKESHYAWQAKLKDGQYLSLDPYAFEILHTYDYQATLYGFSLGLHRWLLYEDADGEKPLRVWISITALSLIIEALLGLYLWLRPKHPLKLLKVNFRAKTKVWLFQLHTLLGVIVCIPLMLIAFSGMTFHWSKATAAVVETLTMGKIEKRPKAPVIQALGEQQWQQAFDNALQRWPDAELYRIYMPADNTDTIDFRMQRKAEIHANSWLWVNPYNGEIQQQHDASQVGVSTQVWNFRYKFHIGAFAGSIVQAIWVALVLLPLFFLGSGFYIWWKRHRR